MCGRYVVTNAVTKTKNIVKTAINVQDSDNYNAHPYQNLPVVKKYKNGNTVENLKWGIIPSWAKQKDFKALINARLETIDEKVSFKKLIKMQRCVVVADGFYEWKNVEGHKRKQPMFLTTIDGSPFAFAGLWEVWSNGQELDNTGEPLQLFSCTLVTCEPNAAIADVHDRMPVMLPPDAWDTWLDRNNRDLKALQELLVPAPSGLIRMHPVSTEVNNVRNNGPHLVDEAEPVTGG